MIGSRRMPREKGMNRDFGKWIVLTCTMSTHCANWVYTFLFFAQLGITLVLCNCQFRLLLLITFPKLPHFILLLYLFLIFVTLLLLFDDLALVKLREKWQIKQSGTFKTNMCISTWSNKLQNRSMDTGDRLKFILIINKIYYKHTEFYAKINC